MQLNGFWPSVDIIEEWKEEGYVHDSDQFGCISLLTWCAANIASLQNQSFRLSPESRTDAAHSKGMSPRFSQAITFCTAND